MLKILIVCSAIDLKYRLGCTPSWWQLIKALHENGDEPVVIPCLGDSIESPWWRTYPNPCNYGSKILNLFLDMKKKTIGLNSKGGKATSITNILGGKLARDRWKERIIEIINKEKDVSAILYMNAPLNFIQGIPEMVESEYGISQLYFDGDMPTILPSYCQDRGFKFNYYLDADLSVFDAFFTNSKGVIPDLEKMGAKNIEPLYYAIDPSLFRPVDKEKTIDVSFFGYGSEMREEWMTNMIAEPSKHMRANFSVGGGGFRVDLGQAREVGDLSYSAFRDFCCSSNICLNITRRSHVSVYASSTARPFELAGYGACVVSQPYNGINEWFTPGKEIMMINSAQEAKETYESLLDDPDYAHTMGQNMRARALKDHTYVSRAQQIHRAVKATA